MGIYTGATIHEVAQVVAAGNAMNGAVVGAAVITKLTRVMMLAPFLIVLSLFLQRRHPGQEGRPPSPYRGLPCSSWSWSG